MTDFAGLLCTNDADYKSCFDQMLPYLYTSEHQDDQQELYESRHLEMALQGGHFFFSRKKNTLVSFSGELTNYEELKALITQKGFEIHTETTEELILYAFKLWGVKFVSYLKGSYAISIFLRNKKRLFLFTDPLGKETIYWYQSPLYFLFSTLQKPLLGSGLIPLVSSQPALSSFLQLGFIPPEHMLTKGLHILPPGHCLEYRLGSFLSVHKNMLKASLTPFDKEKIKHSRVYPLGYTKGESFLIKECSFQEIFQENPKRITLDGYLKVLPELVWMCERPFTNIHLPYALLFASLEAKREGITPVAAIGEELHFPYALEDYLGSFSNPPGFFKNLVYKITSIFPWEISLLFSKPYKRFLWISELTDELSMIPTNLSKYITPYIKQSFSTNVFLRSLAHIQSESDLKVFLQNLAKEQILPAQDLRMLKLFNHYHQIRWSTPLLDHNFSKSSFKGEKPYWSFLPEEIPLLEQVFKQLRKGKISEAGIFKEGFFKRALEMLKNGQASPKLAWGLLSLEAWFQLFADNIPPQEIPKMHFLELSL